MSILDQGFGVGVLQPDELELLQAIFDTVVAQPWFSRDAKRHRQFASFMFRLHRRGMVLPHQLETIVCRPPERVLPVTRVSLRHRDYGSSLGWMLGAAGGLAAILGMGDISPASCRRR